VLLPQKLDRNQNAECRYCIKTALKAFVVYSVKMFFQATLWERTPRFASKLKRWTSLRRQMTKSCCSVKLVLTRPVDGKEFAAFVRFLFSVSLFSCDNICVFRKRLLMWHCDNRSPSFAKMLREFYFPLYTNIVPVHPCGWTGRLLFRAKTVCPK